MTDFINKLKTQIKNLIGYDGRIDHWDRQSVATTYISGQGIEIGALHYPLNIPRTATVKYVDRMTVADLRKQYPELNTEKLVNIDILDNGERLSTIKDASLDFVIANHFLEHCQNPIGAIKNMLRVLKTDGVLYLAIPDKRYSFDIDRPVTTLAHLIRDYEEGPEWSKKQHFEEWVRLVNKKRTPEQIERSVTQLMKSNYSIHFHVWTQDEILELFLFLKKDLKFCLEIEFFRKFGIEVTMILRKNIGINVDGLPDRHLRWQAGAVTI